MANVIEVRGVRIGEGTPKIIVPIVGVTKDEACAPRSLTNDEISSLRHNTYGDISTRDHEHRISGRRDYYEYSALCEVGNPMSKSEFLAEFVKPEPKVNVYDLNAALKWAKLNLNDLGDYASPVAYEISYT